MEKTKNVISMREIQRNYKKLFEIVKKTKKPLYLGRYAEPNVVILDIDSFEKMKKIQTESGKKIVNWAKIYQDLNRIARSGRKNVNLTEFIINDREKR